MQLLQSLLLSVVAGWRLKFVIGIGNLPAVVAHLAAIKFNQTSYFIKTKL
jgi:hypothetical protein